MNTEEEIVERETAFWTESEEFYSRWTATECIMVFPPPVGVMNRDQVLAGIRDGNRWASVTISEAVFRRINESAVSLAYRARAVRGGSTDDYTAYVGSVYVLQDMEWKLGFHQHTAFSDAKTT